MTTPRIHDQYRYLSVLVSILLWTPSFIELRWVEVRGQNGWVEDATAGGSGGGDLGEGGRVLVVAARLRAMVEVRAGEVDGHGGSGCHFVHGRGPYKVFEYPRMFF